MRGHLHQHAAGGRVVQAADVLRDKGLVAPGDANGVLEVAPQGQNRGTGTGQADGAGGIAPGTADELGCLMAGCFKSLLSSFIPIRGLGKMEGPFG